MPFEPAHQVDVRSQMGRELRRNSQRAVFDARQRLTSSSGTRASFDFELLDEYASSRLGGLLAVPALVLILALFASLWVSPLAAAAWAAAVIVANLVVTWFCRQFKTEDPARFNAGRWTATFIAAELVNGISWALLA